MRFYNVEMKGKFKLDSLPSLPSYNPDDEGRLMYYDGGLYYSDSTANTQILTSGAGGVACADCATNATNANDSAALDGQAGSYYLAAGNITGQVPLASGGTGASDAATARTNLGLDGNSNTTHYHDGRYYTETESDTKYGQLTSLNTWTQQNRYNGACTCFQASHDSYLVRVCNSYSAGTVGRGIFSRSCGTAVQAMSDGGTAVYGCSALSNGTGVYGIATGTTGVGVWGCNSTGIGTAGYTDSGTGVYGCATSGYGGRFTVNTGVGVYASSNSGRAGQFYSATDQAVFACTLTSIGFYGWSSGTYGVLGYSSGTAAVAGNTAYLNTSSKQLKHLQNICVSSCLKETPLTVYKYYWEDYNNKGFNQTIGPTAEDFNKTFNVDNSSNGDEYEGVWTVDGAALGLGIENLKEIDILKDIVKKLYSCIQKLEG